MIALAYVSLGLLILVHLITTLILASENNAKGVLGGGLMFFFDVLALIGVIFR